MARTVSKSEPEVVMVALPVCPGVKRYQTVLLMRTPEHRSGSPSSSVATVVSWAFEYGRGETERAFARLSLTGGVPRKRSIASVPAVNSTLPTWMR